MSEVDGEVDGWMGGCVGEVGWIGIQGNGWMGVWVDG